jgi:hypothetical protein
MENDKESDKESDRESDKESDKDMSDKGWFFGRACEGVPG